jgi:hypothetical protein
VEECDVSGISSPSKAGDANQENRRASSNVSSNCGPPADTVKEIGGLADVVPRILQSMVCLYLCRQSCMALKYSMRSHSIPLYGTSLSSRTSRAHVVEICAGAAVHRVLLLKSIRHSSSHACRAASPTGSQVLFRDLASLTRRHLQNPAELDAEMRDYR